ncbi:hypothetical protein JCM6882_009085 [Rhodosporidiobolus microsporus]
MAACEDTNTKLEDSFTAHEESTAAQAVPAADKDQDKADVDEAAPTTEDEKADKGAGGAVATSKPTLPSELVDLVLQCLVDDPPIAGSGEDSVEHTLAACCRVSRTFLALSRPHLCRKKELKLCLQWESGKDWTTTAWPWDWRLYEALVRRRALARLVQEVVLNPCECVDDHYQYDLLHSWVEVEDGIDEGDWLQDDVAKRFLRAHPVDVGLLLECCDNLAVLCIFELTTDVVEERDPSQSVISRYLDGVHLPNLRSLDLPTFCANMAGCARSVTRLDVVLNFDGVSFPLELDDKRSPRLDSLTIRNSHSRPRNWDDPFLQAYNWLTHLSHNSLTSLTIFFHHKFHPMLLPFAALVTLSVYLDNHPKRNLWAMPSFLSSLNSLPPSLQSLSIRNCCGYRLPKDVTLDQTFLVHLPSGLHNLTLGAAFFPVSVWTKFVKEASRCIPGVGELRIVRGKSALSKYDEDEIKHKWSFGATVKVV